MAEATAKTVVDKISQGHLECPICCCRFKDPKILDCLHSFCLNCLEKTMSKQKTEREKIKCPVCRKETQVPDEDLQSLSSSFFLISLVNEIHKQEQLLVKVSTASATCESCEEGQEAISRCLDCKENICKKCQDAHHRMKSLKDHRIIPAQDLDKSRLVPTDLSKTVAPKCRKHIEQPLCFHCETCDTLICALCAATEHRSAEHNFIAITDAIESFRKSVNDTLEKFERSKEQFASNEDSIKHAQNRLQQKLAQARCNIFAKAEAEIAKIRNKAELLTKKVDEIGQERDSEKALKHNRDQMERADQIVTAVNDLMRQADDFGVFELKPKVMHNLEFQKELKCEPAKLDMAFIGVKCQDVVSDTDLGEILLRPKEKWQLKEEFGKEGTDDGEFQWANSVACFNNGDIVVTDTKQKRLSLLTSKGQFKTSVDQGADSNQLEAPCGVVVNRDDLVFVTDQKKVKVFDNKLQFVRDFTPSVDDTEGLSESNLSGIAVDKQRVAVTDKGRKVISVHNLDGSLITSTSNNMFGTKMAMSNNERLIFTKYYKKSLLCIDLKGNEVFNVMTSLNGEPANPTGVLCDDDGSIYVAVRSFESGISEVQNYDSNGAFVATVAEGLYNPLGMAFSPAGDAVVADRHSVKIFERM